MGLLGTTKDNGGMRAVTLALGLWGMVFLPAACGDDGASTSGTAPPPVCNGVVDDDGECVAKCDPAKCVDGNVCVGNACRLQCDSHQDCFVGTQECAPAQTDPDDEGNTSSVRVCLPNGRQPVAPNGFPDGWYGVSCPFGDEQCSAQTACPNGLECDTNACDDCELDEAACEGKEVCNVGRCASSGERCTFNTCPDAECSVFECVGLTSEGDTTAYCSHNCQEDNQCPAGFYCGVTRDPREICGVDGKGNSGICGGATMEPCVDPGEFEANGFFEGSVCLLQNTCLRRDECAPCSDNLDCSLGRGDVCAGHVNEGICARFCDDVADCIGDEVCIPYVPQSGIGGGKTCTNAPNVDCDSPADCPEGGDCVARNVCTPIAGACNGGNVEGDKFCAHCRDDTDCGGPDSTFACVEAGRGEFGCLDVSFPITCSSDSDCPTSPTGANGDCILDQNSGLFQRCYFPRGTEGYTCNP